MKTRLIFFVAGFTSAAALADGNGYGTRGGVLVPDPDGGTPTYTPATSDDNQLHLDNAQTRQVALGNNPFATGTATGTSTGTSMGTATGIPGAPGTMGMPMGTNGTTFGTPSELPNPNSGNFPSGTGGSMGTGATSSTAGGDSR